LWQARVVVRDPKLDRTGSVLHTFEVPKEDGLAISSPVLGDSLESDRVPRPRLRVSRDYRSAGALYCLFRVIGSRIDPATGRPKVRAGYSIEGAGSTHREEAPTPIDPANDGSLRRLLAFGLADLVPGEYDLRLRVIDDVTGQAREVVEPFSRVAPR
jgi:hypothetical protein